MKDPKAVTEPTVVQELNVSEGFPTFDEGIEDEKSMQEDVEPHTEQNF